MNKKQNKKKTIVTSQVTPQKKANTIMANRTGVAIVQKGPKFTGLADPIVITRNAKINSKEKKKDKPVPPIHTTGPRRRGQ